MRDKHEHQIRHQAALCIVHEMPIRHPLVRLAADCALFPAAAPPLRHHLRAKVLRQILDDAGRLGNGAWGRGGFRSGRSGGRDGDDGRLAERVHGLELRAGEHVGAPLVDLQRVRDAQLLEQPEDALGSRLFEPIGPRGRPQSLAGGVG